ncbi:MAG TPA: radical SAM protein [Bacteroidales bacterium]|nr:radical SAM protein [Bacteroidales bacterium]
MKSKDNRIYLLYPPISKFERYSSAIGSAGGEQIPLGVYYLSSYLKKNGFDVKVTDAEAQKLRVIDIINEIKLFAPSYIGISSTTVAFHRALEVAREIKAVFPNIKLILGGPHISSNYKHAMSFKEFDYGVIKEGEYTIVELLEALANGRNLEEVKGIVYRNEQGDVIMTASREYIQNLDLLPFPDYDQISDIRLYTPPPSNYRSLPVINMITSRGCPNQCTFCDNNIFGKKYRQRSAENIFEEIKYLRKKYKVQEIAFVDDTFLIDKRRIYRLFGLLDKENISIHWSCSSRINNTDYDFLKFLKSKGCWYIAFGIESGDEDVLKVIKKNISLDAAHQVIGWCKELKIKTKGFFIIGHPTETIETINKTIQVACKLPLDDIVVTINTPIPGTQQYAEISKYGTIDETNWAEFNYWRPVFVPYGLTKEILLKKHKEIYRRFYLRPRIILRYFTSFFTKGGFRRFLSVFKASFFIIKK